MAFSIFSTATVSVVRKWSEGLTVRRTGSGCDGKAPMYLSTSGMMVSVSNFPFRMSVEPLKFEK